MSTVERVRGGRPRLDLDGGPAHGAHGGPAHRPRLDPSLFPAELRRGRGGGGGRRGWEEAADGRVGGHGVGGGVVGGGGHRGWEEAGGDTSARGRGGRRGWREERCSYTRWVLKSTSNVTLILMFSVMFMILMFSEMVERGGYTSLDLLDGDCVLRPQVLSFLYGWCVLMLPNSKFPPRV